MRISDWSSDVCSSDLDRMRGRVSSISGLAISASNELGEMQSGLAAAILGATGAVVFGGAGAIVVTALWAWIFPQLRQAKTFAPEFLPDNIDLKTARSEEHTSELQTLMRISYAVFCLKKKKQSLVT